MPIAIRLKVATTTARSLYGTPIVTAETRSGERFQLQATFKDLAHAQRTAAKVMERSTIDRSLWAPLMPRAGSAADLALRAQAASADIYAERYAACTAKAWAQDPQRLLYCGCAGMPMPMVSA